MMELIDFLKEAAQSCVDPSGGNRKYAECFLVEVFTTLSPYCVEISIAEDSALSEATICVTDGGYADDTHKGKVFSLTAGKPLILYAEKGQYLTARIFGNLFVPLKHF